MRVDRFDSFPNERNVLLRKRLLEPNQPRIFPACIFDKGRTTFELFLYRILSEKQTTLKTGFNAEKHIPHTHLDLRPDNLPTTPVKLER